MSGIRHFEVGSFLNRADLIRGILAENQALPNEQGSISQVDPRQDFYGTVAEYLDGPPLKGRRPLARNQWRLS